MDTDLSMIQQEYEVVFTDRLQPHPANPRRGDVEAIVASIEANGFRGALIVQKSSHHILAGNHRWQAAMHLGMEKVPVFWVDVDDDTALRILLADNRSSDLGAYDDDLLLSLLRDLPDLSGTGYSPRDLDDLLADLAPPTGPPEGRGRLAEKFLVPPFSILDARKQPWKQRKQHWMSLGIRSEVGRGEDSGKTSNGRPGSSPWTEDLLKMGAYTASKALTLSSLSGRVPDYYYQKQAAEERLGRKLGRDEFEANYLKIPEGSGLSTTGTSVFDPVICELAYRWFAPPNATVLDPFAGGSVRGIVAGVIGHQYTGVELRPEQVAANEDQADEIPTEVRPQWITGDSRTVIPTLTGEYDLVFTCPPYADLEIYSDDPADISNMKYDDFLVAYREIIAATCARLRDNRFAVVVVGEVRDRATGTYYNFLGDTVQAFTDAGLSYFNEMILVTPTGSLAMRTERQFLNSRKIGKTHQNVLVFLKGNCFVAAEECGDIDLSMLQDYQDDEDEA